MRRFMTETMVGGNISYWTVLMYVFKLIKFNTDIIFVSDQQTVNFL
jgi:hypothetical protein